MSKLVWFLSYLGGRNRASGRSVRKLNGQVPVLLVLFTSEGCSDYCRTPGVMCPSFLGSKAKLA